MDAFADRVFSLLIIFLTRYKIHWLFILVMDSQLYFFIFFNNSAILFVKA